MKLPRVTAPAVLLSLLGVLLLASVDNTRESLHFCEKALYGQAKMLEKDQVMKAPIKFSEVCPEVRARAETTLNKWLEVILALLVQWHPPPPGP